ncbi:MAG: DNA-3-methyladenine glycosylase I [Candidatus Cloacimonetes bacterium]|nr:DNA-3-methyladenine glycosylase I [Candidatus Cloacimonadota bacterium]
MPDRCFWAENPPIMRKYHDQEWGVPVHDDRKHFEFLLLDSFQAGLSWLTILNKRENFRKAFADFHPEIISHWSDRECENLLQDKGIIRNRLKIRAAVNNARHFLEICEKFGSFDNYIWMFTDGRTIQNEWNSIMQIPVRTENSDRMSKDLKKRGFSFVGSTICYAYMQAAGMVNDHLTCCFRHQEVKRLEVLDD